MSIGGGSVSLVSAFLRVSMERTNPDALRRYTRHVLRIRPGMRYYVTCLSEATRTYIPFERPVVQEPGGGGAPDEWL
jgi:hypothetical protein